MQEIINIINSVGFPIVACMIMFNQNSKLSNAISELNITLTKIQSDIDSLKNNQKQGE
ncbi:holin [Clostridium phage phi24R]|uniref:YvrJ family protein n=2 Tax=Gregsiragusavirus TaxID=2842711 RepID=A0A976XN78_9CAUD|nr:holin [Clostridium phage phi24R]AEW47847.1 hypothetical protein phi24R_gp15 [Clostridium phage phi24R]UVD33114.1 hypothetical protein [Clostridium phage vB_CpeP_PM11]